ncbi:MAG: TIM-barrel domain-containing protein [Flavobacteriales bacterium]
MAKFFFLLCISIASFEFLAQNPNRQFISFNPSANGAEVQVSDGKYLIKFYSNNIIETTFIPVGKNENIEPSHAVIMQPMISDQLPTEVSKNGNIVVYQFQLSKTSISARIQLEPFQISYWYQGRQISSEAMGYQLKETPQIQLNLSEQEQLMGAGARALGMNRRGYRLQLYNRAHYGYENHSELMNFTMPIVISDQCYAIHFDNPQIGYLDLDANKENKLTYEVIGGPMRYQVIVADDWKQLTEQLTNLTGRQPLPARWTLGNFSSRFGYHSEQEARAVVNEFRKQQIPLDAIVFDLYWFGKDIQGTLGNFEFFRDSFPNGEQMIADFRKQNVKTVLITEPFVLTTSKKWNEADQMKILGTDTLGKSYRYDFYFGNTGLIDLYKPEARVWFWEIYKKLHGYGAAGIWGDLGEPEVHPTKLKHGDKWADEVHNIYGHDWARLLAEGYRKDYPNERPFILMRAGYSGSQHFGMVPWSGDVNRTWGGLKPQMEISMQMGLQGMAYMHSDLGGFAGANNDPELYVRWLQYGVFQPIFRPHAQQEVASEAVYKDAETKALAKAAIELRYQLLPYNYSLAYENTTKGTPLLRPIFMEFPEAKWSFESADSYMWGPAFFVHAITDSLESEVYKNLNMFTTLLPQSASWFDFHSGRLVANEKLLNVSQTEYHVLMTPKTLQHIPVFVRSGSFIPMSPVVQSTDDYKDSNVILHYYIDAQQTSLSSEFTWYEDDGYLFDADAKGEVKKMICKSIKSAEKCTIDFNAQFGAQYQKEYFRFELLIHTNKAPKCVKMAGKKVKFSFDEKNQVLHIDRKTTLNNEQNVSQVEIKW